MEVQFTSFSLSPLLYISITLYLPNSFYPKLPASTTPKLPNSFTQKLPTSPTFRYICAALQRSENVLTEKTFNCRCYQELSQNGITHYTLIITH